MYTQNKEFPPEDKIHCIIYYSLMTCCTFLTPHIASLLYTVKSSTGYWVIGFLGFRKPDNPAKTEKVQCLFRWSQSDIQTGAVAACSEYSVRIEPY